ncbi:MAG: DUF3540 domain-containing protein [Gammaproteobacteria bacterium]|nr:DUF3540 domain-containing protein [Gammaproteobacteria bacterium]
MQQQSNIFPITEQLSYFGPATVIEDEDKQGRVRVRLNQGLNSQTCIATVACSRSHLLLSQVNVLVAGNDTNNLYVIGLLGIPFTDAMSDDKASSDTEIKASNGAFSRVSKTDTQETLAIYSNKNELVFEYNPVSKQSTVNLPEGDFSLNVKNGNILLNAGKTVEINSDTLNLTSKKLNIKSFIADMVLGRLETTTDTLVENAKNVYRTVKELTQLRTGRNRTFVEETYQLNADKVLLKSENDVKVKADKIHLG